MAKEIFLDELEKSEDVFLDELPAATAVDNSTFTGTTPIGDRFALQDPKPINQGKDIYKSLYEEDVPWDTSVLNKVELQESFINFEDYDFEGRKNINALYYADQFGIPPDDAYALHDQLGESFFDTLDTSGGYYERIKNRYKNGVLNNAIADRGVSLLDKFLKDPASVNLEQELKIITALQKGYTPKINEDVLAWHEKMLGATAEQLPVLGRGIKGGLRGGAAGAASGGTSGLLLGLVIPTVGEEPFTATAGLFYGLKVGSALGAGIEIGKLEAGGEFANLMSIKDEDGNSIDPRIAVVASLGVGVINGGIEVAEWAILLSTFGIGTKIFENAARKVTSKIIAEGTLRNVVVKHVLKFGGQLTAETVQELTQETTSIIAEELAKELNNSRKGTDFKPITKEVLTQRIGEVTIESLRAFPALLLPGTIISTTREGIKITRPPTQEMIVPAVPEKPPTPEPKIIDEVFKGDGTGIISEDKQQQVPQQVKESAIEEQINSIVDEPLTQEQAQEPLTSQETAAIKKLEAEIELDEAEVVNPELHIGNVTQRMKKKFAKIFGKQPEDVKGFIGKEGFPTKKTPIEMTKGEAKEYLSFLEEDLASRLDKNLIRTENDLARANADWGDIKATKTVLGEKIGNRPFTVKRAGKAKVFTIESTKERISASLRPGILEDSRLTVSQVLGTTLKRMAQAARHAFSVGKKEGIFITKKHFRDLKEAKKIRQNLKKRINTALKTINKDVPKSVDFFYREAINKLQKEVDTKKRTKNTKQRQQEQRKFLAQATKEQKADFPQKLFDTLNAKPLDNATIEELEQLATERKRLEKLGKTKKSAKINTARLKRQNNIKKAIKTMAKVKTSPEQDGFGYVTNNRGLITRLLTIHISTLRTPRLLDWLDGRLGTFKGLMHDLFYNRVNTQTSKELLEIDRRHKFMREKMDSFKITDTELVRVIDLSGIKSGLQLYIEQIMGMYTALKNKKARQAVLNGLRISEKQAQAIVSNITGSKFITLADSVIEDYNENYGRLRDAHINFTDEDLGREDFYTPIVRLETNGIVSNDDITDQLLARSGLKRSQAAREFTIERLNIAPENQKPIDLRLMSVWRSQSVKQEHYIHFAELIKDLNGYLNDSKLEKSINNLLGPSGHKILENYVKRVANPNIYKGFGSIESLSRKLRGNMAIAYLSYNLLTILKQAPSLALYLKDAGATSLISSFGEFIANPSALLKKVQELDPQIRANIIAREFVSLERANDPTILKLINKVGRAGLQGIIHVDRVIRSIGWNAVYEKELSLHGSETEAIREAQNSTLRTQPTASAKDLADLYTQNEILNWFLVFTQQLNQIWNIVTYDIFAHWNNQNYQKSATDILAVSLNAMLIWMVSNKRLPEDEDDFLDMATDQMINIVPLLGKDILAGTKGWGGTEIAPLQAAKEISGAIASGNRERIAIKFLEQSAVATGIPITAIKRGTEFLESGELIELFGGER